MQSIKVKTLLETATNIAVLLTCIVLLGLSARSYFGNSTPKFSPGLQKGAAIGAPPGVDYKNSPRTLLIAMSSQCGYCAASIPFYKRLAEEQKDRNGATRLLAITPDKEDTAKQYLQKQQLQIDILPSVDLKSINVSATPTIILVDNSGKILDFWVGKLSPQGEQQVLSSVLKSPI